jgi:hypothetical protein
VRRARFREVSWRRTSYFYASHSVSHTSWADCLP